MTARSPSLVLLALFGAGLAVGAPAWAAAKKKPVPADPGDGKRVIAVSPVDNVRIEMPDESRHDFGDDFYAALTTRLTKSGKYIVADPSPPGIGVESSALRALGNGPDFQWPAGFVPAAHLRISVEALSFTTGSRGEQMMYGFDERLRTPYNDGFGTADDEYPLRSISFEPNWFDRTFDQKGSGPVNSRTGLDIGDGLKIDVLFAWLAVKYARYVAQLGLRVDIDAPLGGKHEFRLVRVKGEGFFFDVSGAYQGYSAGIRVARNDAMLQALRRALDGAFAAVERGVQGLPLTGRVDSIVQEGGRPLYLLGTGLNAEVKPGVRYELVDAPTTVLEVERSVQSGALARLVLGNASDVKPGRVIKQHFGNEITPAVAGLSMALRTAETSDIPAATESVELPWTNIEKSKFKDGEIPDISFFTALAKSVVELVLLPYRIWRWGQYDRSYKEKPDAKGTPDEWATAARDSVWAKQIGLDQAGPGPAGDKDAVTVAVIDTGVDYNHPAIHDALWINPTPWADPQGRKDRYGWDFMSGDAHAADDGYHGTQVASAVLAVAPHAKILPLKVFNPWGITRSAALLGAFQYAVDHGAKVIVCGWATRQSARAIELGVLRARELGVAVVAAAGDRGDELSEVAAYPAAFGAKYENVLTVTGVDPHDALVVERGRYANFGAKAVRLAAPGQAIRVAEPRHEYSTVTSTAVAAGIAAGALARLGGGTRSIQPLLDAADRIPALEPKVHNGLRLRVH